MHGCSEPFRLWIILNGLEPAYGTPEALAAMMESDVAHFARLVKAIGISPQ